MWTDLCTAQALDALVWIKLEGILKIRIKHLNHLHELNYSQ